MFYAKGIKRKRKETEIIMKIKRTTIVTTIPNLRNHED
jgi:hypothetical protein